MHERNRVCSRQDARHRALSRITTLLVIGLVFSGAIWSAGSAFAGAKPGTIVYRAGGSHGWAGWHAPAWSILNGELTADGQRGEIRVPYVPARHGVSDYRVMVYVAQANFSLLIPTVAEPYPPDAGFAIRVRRSGPGGYSLHAYDCDYAPCLVLRTLPVHPFGIGNTLAEADWEESGRIADSVFVLQVRGTRISGSWTSDQGQLHLSVENRRYRQGGFIALYADPRVRLAISRVVVSVLS